MLLPRVPVTAARLSPCALPVTLPSPSMRPAAVTSICRGGACLSMWLLLLPGPALPTLLRRRSRCCVRDAAAALRRPLPPRLLLVGPSSAWLTTAPRPLLLPACYWLASHLDRFPGVLIPSIALSIMHQALPGAPERQPLVSWHAPWDVGRHPGAPRWDTLLAILPAAAAPAPGAPVPAPAARPTTAAAPAPAATAIHPPAVAAQPAAAPAAAPAAGTFGSSAPSG